MLKKNPNFKLLFNLFIIIVTIKSSHAYYCDHNFCGHNQFCCGDNVCCLYLNDHWTYYFCLTSFAFILTWFIWAVYHYFFRKKKNHIYKSDEGGFLNSKINKDNYA